MIRTYFGWRTDDAPSWEIKRDAWPNNPKHLHLPIFGTHSRIWLCLSFLILPTSKHCFIDIGVGLFKLWVPHSWQQSSVFCAAGNLHSHSLMPEMGYKVVACDLTVSFESLACSAGCNNGGVAYPFHFPQNVTLYALKYIRYHSLGVMLVLKASLAPYSHRNQRTRGTYSSSFSTCWFHYRFHSFLMYHDLPPSVALVRFLSMSYSTTILIMMLLAFFWGIGKWCGWHQWQTILSSMRIPHLEL